MGARSQKWPRTTPSTAAAIVTASSVVQNQPGVIRSDARSHALERASRLALHVAAFEADQPRGAVASRRVDVALVVELRHPRLQRIRAHVADLARRAVLRGLDQLPVAHHRLAHGLAVDRPVLAVIVRLALLRPVVDVGQDAEAELRVLVDDLALRHVVAQVPGDEGLVRQHLAEQRADLFTALRIGLGGEDAMGGGGEVLERVRHGRPPSWWTAVGSASAVSRSTSNSL